MVSGKGVRRERLSNIFHPINPKIVIIRNPISTGPCGSKLAISILLSTWIFYRVPSEVCVVAMELEELVRLSLSS